MLELLRTRRSIRKYEDKKIEPEKIELLKEALLRAPSSRSLNPWQFIFVDNPQLLQKLSQCKEHGAAFIKNAALGIVVCGDEKESDVWVEDCSIAAIVGQLVAHSLGLGSCWIQIRNRSYDAAIASEIYIQNLLGLPAHLKVECLLSVGYPAEKKKPASRASLLFDRIKTNHG
ncbi:MAG: NAD(P)H-dependent dehydrogenase/reductase [Desulfobacteraceae bacterium]|nr:MAG: NAD(P)H-dependent dehydrogenase/reductase [Desulfobacteraceae bacterium]